MHGDVCTKNLVYFSEDFVCVKSFEIYSAGNVWEIILCWRHVHKTLDQN